MPQQNPLGPFGDYITKPLEPTQQPKPTGWEGTAGNIANIATQFLNSVKQARAQKFGMQQMQESQEEEKINRTLDFINKADLSPQDKQHLTAPLMQTLIGRLASDKDFSSKNTGHPLTDFVKNIAVNITGGQLPNKKQPLDPNLISEAMLHATNPENSLTHKKSLLEQRAHAAISGIIQAKGDKATFDDLYNDPAIGVLSQEWTDNGLEGHPFAITQFAQSHPRQQPLNPLQEEQLVKIKQENAGYREAFDLPSPGVPGTPAANIQPIATTAPPSVSATTTATPPVSGTVNLDKLRKQNHYIPGGNKLGEQKQFVMPDGSFQNGIEVSSKGFTGVVDPQGNELKGAKEATTAQINKPKAEDVKLTFDTSRATINNAIKDAGIKTSHLGLLDIAEKAGNVNAAESIAQKAIDAQRLKDDQAVKQAEISSKYSEVADRKDLLRADRLLADAKKSKPFELFIKVQNNYDATKAAMERASQTGDHSLADVLAVRALAIVTDPDTGIKDQEFKTFTNAMGWTEQQKVKLKNLIEGKGEIMDDKMRNDVLQAIKDRYSALKQNKDDVVRMTVQQAKQSGKGIESYVTDSFGAGGHLPQSTTTATATPPGQTTWGSKGAPAIGGATPVKTAAPPKAATPAVTPKAQTAPAKDPSQLRFE